MYKYDDEIHAQILKEIHSEFNAGITYIPSGNDLPKNYNSLTKNIATDFDGSLVMIFACAIQQLEGLCFPCVINCIDEKNAFAERRYDIPVIGIFLPLAVECLALAHSFAMFNDYFNITRPITHYDYKYFTPDIEADGNFRLECAKNQEARTFADIIAYLSLKFTILHEVGHHHYKHLDNIKSGRLKSHGNDESDIVNIELQKLESQADMWATLNLVNDFIQIRKYFNKHLPRKVSNLEAIKILYLAIMIPLLATEDGITPDNLLYVNHPPACIRHTDVTQVFVSALGENGSINNRYWRLIKNELLNEYIDKEWLREDIEEMLNTKVDIAKEIRQDNFELIPLLIRSWLNESYAYITLRYFEMCGGTYNQIVEQYEGLSEKLKELTEKDYNFSETLIVDL